MASAKPSGCCGTGLCAQFLPYPLLCCCVVDTHSVAGVRGAVRFIRCFVNTVVLNFLIHDNLKFGKCDPFCLNFQYLAKSLSLLSISTSNVYCEHATSHFITWQQESRKNHKSPTKGFQLKGMLGSHEGYVLLCGHRSNAMIAPRASQRSTRKTTRVVEERYEY